MDWEKGLGPRLPGVFSLLCFADSGVRVWARGPRFLLPAGPAGATQCSAAETPEQVALCQLLTFLLLEKLLPARGGAAAPRALQPPSPPPPPPRAALWVSVLVRSSLSHHWSWPPLSECPSLPLTHEPTPRPLCSRHRLQWSSLSRQGFGLDGSAPPSLSHPLLCWCLINSTGRGLPGQPAGNPAPAPAPCASSPGACPGRAAPLDAAGCPMYPSLTSAGLRQPWGTFWRRKMGRSD